MKSIKDIAKLVLVAGTLAAASGCSTELEGKYQGWDWDGRSEVLLNFGDSPKNITTTALAGKNFDYKSMNPGTYYRCFGTNYGMDIILDSARTLEYTQGK